jgi:hypothetical protein
VRVRTRPILTYLAVGVVLFLVVMAITPNGREFLIQSLNKITTKDCGGDRICLKDALISCTPAKYSFAEETSQEISSSSLTLFSHYYTSKDTVLEINGRVGDLCKKTFYNVIKELSETDTDSSFGVTYEVKKTIRLRKLVCYGTLISLECEEGEEFELVDSVYNPRGNWADIGGINFKDASSNKIHVDNNANYNIKIKFKASAPNYLKRIDVMIYKGLGSEREFITKSSNIFVQYNNKNLQEGALEFSIPDKNIGNCRGLPLVVDMNVIATDKIRRVVFLYNLYGPCRER